MAKLHILEKSTQRSPTAFAIAKSLADQLLDFLNQAATKDAIELVHKACGSSTQIQAIIFPCAQALGFLSEKTGLFKASTVPSLRPDYFRPLGDSSGVLLEVERGKTLDNNMDLLDLWKCHICDKAEYLFLVVPMQRTNTRGQVRRTFETVVNRLSPFFEPECYVRVEAVFIFGY